MNDDDLRERLTKAMSDSTLAPYLAKQIMPVVREALAAAWDDGYDLGQDDMLDSRDARRPNPWREDA